jgi:hypothetical protein
MERMKMSKFTEWQVTRSKLKAAKDWIANRTKIDSQDGQCYAKVKLQKVKLEYCGQSSAGANNYHEAPLEFQHYIAKAINNMRVEIEDHALDILNEDNDRKARHAKASVLDMLAEIKHVEGE